MQHQINQRFLQVMFIIFISACSVNPPQDRENICELFRENTDWYEAANVTYKKWGLPVHVQMAIMFQESGFVADAQPPRVWHLGFIPGDRLSSAYGYAQALDETWEHYLKHTGRSDANRDNFADALDFIGWYCNLSYLKLGLSKWNANDLYLAYHEGHGGYQRQTFLNKNWLIHTAKKVAMRAGNYRTQISKCENEFKSNDAFF